MEEWRKIDCQTTNDKATHVSQQCNSSVPLTYLRLIERFFIETIGRHMYGHFSLTMDNILNVSKAQPPSSTSSSPKHSPKLPPRQSFAHITEGFTKLFVKEQFQKYPTAIHLHETLSVFFGSEGNTCVRETFADMMVGVEAERAKFFSFRQMELMASDYIRNVIGKPLRYRLEKYPYPS